MQATISEDGLYRYDLYREVNPLGTGICCFNMLNPSKADARINDPTITRDMGYARDWGYRWMSVGNLFAGRTPDPKEMKKMTDPVGPENDAHLVRLAEEADLLIFGWGIHGSFMGRDRQVTGMLQKYNPMCLGTTKNGSPKHPLYLKKDLVPIPYEPNV